MNPIRHVLASLPLIAQKTREKLECPDWHPTEQEIAEARHALALAPIREQDELELHTAA